MASHSRLALAVCEQYGRRLLVSSLYEMCQVPLRDLQVQVLCTLGDVLAKTYLWHNTSSSSFM
jgi:hypothetical protein